MFQKLIDWSLTNYSDLPWRKKRSVYTTLVSEIMLQQTTVKTVLSHYDRFLKTYPTLKMIALASEEEVLANWKGLGYYRRARSLRNASVEVFEKFSGKIPESYDQLLTIKGIGPYTANALLSIGHDQMALAIDGNLERVISRLYQISQPKGLKLQREIAERFSNEEIFPARENLSGRELNEALMDLGREICLPKKPKCDCCPLTKSCQAFASKKQEHYPVVTMRKKEKSFQLDLLRVIVEEGDQILAYQKKKGEWLEGQWEIPTFTLYSEDEKFTGYPSLEIKNENLQTFKTAITKYRINNKVYKCSKEEFFSLTGVKNCGKYQLISRKKHLSTGSEKAFACFKSELSSSF